MPLDDDDLIAAAELGEEARKFIESDLGKSLLAAAEQDAMEAMEHLGATDPDDKKELVRWQIELKAARKFKEHLLKFVGMGENALSIWKQQQDEG